MCICYFSNCWNLSKEGLILVHCLRILSTIGGTSLWQWLEKAGCIVSAVEMQMAAGAYLDFSFFIHSRTSG